jgi:peptide-methionine (R)-S-oxide reductase
MRLSDPTRRRLLGSALALGAATLAARAWAASPEQAFADSPFRRLTKADWRKRLSPASFEVLRDEATEFAGTSPLLGEHRKGLFVCMGCDLPLFRSEWKFDSHTGWPSFYRAIDGALGFKRDFAIGVERKEYHCARCLGHQGHVFDDGPPPTGLRYCNNGAGLRFVVG